MKAWAGSALVHGVAVLVAWLSTLASPRPLEYEVIQIAMVDAPEEEFVLETPDPVPPAEVEAPDPDPEPPPVQEEPPPEPEEEEPEVEEEPPTPKPDPAPPPQRTEESVEARMEGLRRDFPEYYAEIQLQIKRCFRWTRQADLEATVDFFIDADGSVPGRDIEIRRSSGNTAFDLRAVEAVECAGRRLPPLPEELPYERLPVRFNFTPIGSEGPTPGAPEPGRPETTRLIRSAPHGPT